MLNQGGLVRTTQSVREARLRDVEFAVIDVETTGLMNRDRIIEVAVSRIDLNGTVLGEFESLVNPGRTGATTVNIHGITDRELRDAPSFEEISGDLAEILDGAIWAAHNASFDRRFLDLEFSRLEAEVPAWPTVCTMRLSSAAGIRGQRTLAACCSYFGVSRSGDAHQAMDDVDAAVALLLTLLAARADTRFVEVYGTEGPEWALPLPVFPPCRKAARRALRRTEVEAELVVDRNIARGLGAPDEGIRRYLERLDAAMEDRMIEPIELEELIRIATEVDLSPSQAREIHSGYSRVARCGRWRMAGLIRAKSATC